MPKSKNVLVNLASTDEEAEKAAQEEEKVAAVPVPDPAHQMPSVITSPENFGGKNRNDSSSHYAVYPNTSEQSPLLSKYTDSDSDSAFVNNVENDPSFGKIIRSTEEAMYMGIFPERIYQGSSGSYFAKDKNKVNYFLIFLGCKPFFFPGSNGFNLQKW